jgi:hypothetical protein
MSPSQVIKALTFMSNFFMHTLAKHFIPDSSNLPARRYDLDWLRVIAFVFLILFHCGMFYVENWGWHVKSQYRSAFLENIMLIISPWRMPLLWLISGIAMRFIMAKVTIWHFISARTLRILLPLLFGIIVVVPPQLYIEMTSNGDLNMSYWQFIRVFFSEDNLIFAQYQAGIWPHIDVNHLWFLRSLWQYSLIMLCILPLLNTSWVDNLSTHFFKLPAFFAIPLATLPLLIIELNWQFSDVRYPLGFTFMLYGYLIGWQPSFWQRFRLHSNGLVLNFILAYICVIYFYNQVWSIEKIAPGTNSPLLLLLGTTIYSLLSLLGVLILFNFAYRCLNKNSSYLRYLNEAVYPFYILHQTFIIVFGYSLSLLNLSATLEASILVIVTFSACILSVEIIKRINLLRPCFGLKMRKSNNIVYQRIAYISAVILIVPIALEILI